MEIVESGTSALDIARATMYFYSVQEQRLKTQLNELLDPMGLQKRLYFSQMFSLYFFKKSLFYEDFEAWEYGPVIPELYQTKKYTPELLNQEYIPQRFEEIIIETVFNILLTTSSVILSDISHEKNSAWQRLYQDHKLHIKIPKKDIIDYPCQSLIKASELFLNQEEEKRKNMPLLIGKDELLDAF